MKRVTIQNKGDRGDSLDFHFRLPESFSYEAQADLMNISRRAHYVTGLFVIELRFGIRRILGCKFIESCVEEKNNAKNSMNGTECNQNVALAFKCSGATTQKLFFDTVSAESQRAVHLKGKFLFKTRELSSAHSLFHVCFHSSQYCCCNWPPYCVLTRKCNDVATICRCTLSDAAVQSESKSFYFGIKMRLTLLEKVFTSAGVMHALPEL